MKVLFICKDRTKHYGYDFSYGLINSATFVSNFLNLTQVDSKVVTVIDANGIDKVVHDYKPDYVFIEAIWVPPLKFSILFKLHPKVKWVIRVHSKTAFLSTESLALTWLKEYRDLGKVNPRFSIAFNNYETNYIMNEVFGFGASYLPNLYVIYNPYGKSKKVNHGTFVDIGCFGALRILKNQLPQAVASMIFAEYEGLILRFHINENNVESNTSIVKNLKALFEGKAHELIVHPWQSHKDFIGLVRQMDLGLQVSYSESFNIVAADFVDNGVPILVSEEIDWLPKWYRSSYSILDMVEGLQRIWNMEKENSNKEYLNKWNSKAEKEWQRFLNI
jgi:hypothetical protein